MKVNKNDDGTYTITAECSGEAGLNLVVRPENAALAINIFNPTSSSADFKEIAEAFDKTSQIAPSAVFKNASETRANAHRRDREETLGSTHSGSIWSSLKGFFRDFSNWWSAGLCMTTMVFSITALAATVKSESFSGGMVLLFLCYVSICCGVSLWSLYLSFRRAVLNDATVLCGLLIKEMEKK